MAQQGGNNDDDLRSLMQKLLVAYQEEDDMGLSHKADLDKIFDILKANDGKITSQPPGLEKKEAEDLGKLMRDIEIALRQRKAWWEQQQQQQSPAAKSKKKTMPSVSDCNPFKSRPEPEPEPDHPPAASVELLLQRTKDMLGHGAEVTTEFYEWTTSYINEENIYGWDDEANKVADALVGGGEGEDKDGEQILFRAAGIVGIHGSGKTVLAQKVFIHDKIKDAFPLRLWVCVGPPDHEDRACLLYRMLDNLGLDTYKVEDIVNGADVVKKAAGSEAGKEKRSKIGVLLFILHVTLHRTGHPYLIVFDDIRTYDIKKKGGEKEKETEKEKEKEKEEEKEKEKDEDKLYKDGSDGWYSNLTLEPPKDREWHERLAYGLPKTRKSAVLVTCRREDDARAMVRTGRVFRPPKLGADNGWKLFEREYNKAKEEKKKKEKEKEEEEKEKEKEEDKLYKELEEMKEQIVDKCLGLPVAIIEAAKGFVMLEYEPPRDQDRLKAEAKAKAAADETAPTTSSSTEPAAHQSSAKE